jgi:hypothetical protein
MRRAEAAEARIVDLRRQLDDAGKAAFMAHMEERNRREAAEARVAVLERFAQVVESNVGRPVARSGVPGPITVRMDRIRDALAAALAATDAAGGVE